VSSFFAEYGVFLAELLTILALLALVALLLVASARRGAMTPQGLTVKKINDKYEEAEAVLKRVTLGKRKFLKEKRLRARQRKREKAKQADDGRPRVFVIDFRGDIRASNTASLREEIDAILRVAKENDTVLLRLENAGGAVHEHGFAASQLLRLKSRGIKLIVAVDKVAASGGYLMACVADHVMAAPFAIVGSIGVVAQLPNFHRYLDSRGIDFEQITAGRFKRTLTLFGKNTEEGRQKLKDELEDVHALFKAEISAHRPDVDLEKTATGEHWYGVRALELKLVDELRTSDDYLLETVKSADVFQVRYKRHKSLAERMLNAADSLLYG
jgi:serine protease SohB